MLMLALKRMHEHDLYLPWRRVRQIRQGSRMHEVVGARQCTGAAMQALGTYSAPSSTC